MAEGTLFYSVQKISLLLGSYAVQQIGLAWGVKKKLKKLQDTMSILENVLQDAEKKEVNNGAVKEWLQRLKVVVRDADDLLDEFATEDLRRQVQTQGSKIKEVHNFFTSSNSLKFRYGMGRKIKDIMERLDQIVSEMEKFNFIVGVVDRPVEIRKREETYSFVDSSNVIGRNGDRDAIIRWLESSTSEQNVQVLPIVAMGGMGKTTLAQLVFNDPRVKSQFKPLWACVSDNFDVKTVISKIVNGSGETSLTIEALQIRLREVLGVGKYFLVLDDVWIEDRVEWTKLEVLLKAGAGGSRIVVTTRSPKVAEVVGTMAPYKLKGLSEMECLSILVQWAFKGGEEFPYELKGLSDEECLSILVKWALKEGEDSKHKDLVNIGRQIVKKCGGVPLAARSLGALLFSVTDEREWCSLRDNEMWPRVQKESDILPVLKWSYDQMPSGLKQCFGYCSLFKKDAVLDKEVLIYQWMALGFIQSSSEQNKELEDIGESYFDELLRMSFILLQDGIFEHEYKMHDLVHDLAQSVGGSECFVIKHNNTEMIPTSVSHVSFHEYSILYGELPRPLLKVRNKWRTILWPYERVESFYSSFEKLVSSSKCLRVLCMPCVYGGITKNIALPSSIGKLKHLRFLRCRNWKELPKSFGKLLNLQYLYLEHLYIRELPEDFRNLINLRFLWLSAKLMTCLPEKGIGGLTSLRILRLVRNPELVSLGEGIRHLTCLRELSIEGCRKLESLPSGMRYLAALEKLEISRCCALIFSEDDFQGLRKLKSLYLIDLDGLVSLPKGLQDATASLNHLTIVDCFDLTTLAECLPSLTSLRTLKISRCPALSSLPEGMQSLTALQHLKIDNCPTLTERFEEERHKIAHVPKIEIDGRQLRNRIHMASVRCNL